MNVDVALEVLACTSGKNLSEVGEAVDVLYNSYGSYSRIIKECKLDLSPDYLSIRRKIFLLPRGIRWKVDVGVINLSQINEIVRLSNENDQWLLAVLSVDKKLTTLDCKRVVNLVVKERWTLRSALRDALGIRLDVDEVHPVLLSIGWEFWFGLTKSAWGTEMEWQDYCYDIIQRGLRVDVIETASRIVELAVSLRDAGSRHSSDD